MAGAPEVGKLCLPVDVVLVQEKNGPQNLKAHWRRLNDGAQNAVAAGALQGSVQTAGQFIRMQTTLRR